jgi:DNA replication and repair protein RecF
MNVFVGDNAQGKTNILEAIYYLSLTKSHRVGTNPNIFMFGKNSCKISGTVKKDKIVTKLEVKLTDDIKKLKVNNTNIVKVSDYISNLNVIIFTPDDLEIIKGSPSIRRNLLNIQLSQISKQYLSI